MVQSLVFLILSCPFRTDGSTTHNKEMNGHFFTFNKTQKLVGTMTAKYIITVHRFLLMADALFKTMGATAGRKNNI